MDFYKLLWPTPLAADRDKKTFTDWADGVITTEMAISDFKWNNHNEILLKRIADLEVNRWSR